MEQRSPLARPDDLRGRLDRIIHGRAGSWAERLVRFGYATRGVIFTLIGLLAARAAVGATAPTGTRGALRALGHQPFGQVLLALTAVGMAGYTLWRFAQAVLAPAHGGRRATGIVRRLGFLGSGLFYALVALTTAQLAFGLEVGENAREAWTAWALSLPFGRWLVGAVGIVLAGAGLHSFYRAAVAEFMVLYPSLEERGMRAPFARRVGQVGLLAIGLTLCIIGGFVVLAAVYAEPAHAIGIGGALQVLGDGPYGPLLLGLVATGLVIYGVHCFVLGWYRRVRPDL